MKIFNKTKWQTTHLRAFAAKIAAVELEPAKRREIIVTFVASRTRGVSGYANIGGRRCLIRLPRPGAKTPVDKPALAMLIAHEMTHLRGFGSGRSNELRLRSSAKYGYRGDYKTYYAWANDMPLEAALPKAKAKPSPDAKAERIRELIVTWARKRKRADTAIRKYQKRLKYYETKLAAMPAKGGAT